MSVLQSEIQDPYDSSGFPYQQIKDLCLRDLWADFLARGPVVDQLKILL